MKNKIKYDVINPRTGGQESWTGTFDNNKYADEWYKKHGKTFESEGKKIVRMVLIDNNGWLRRAFHVLFRILRFRFDVDYNRLSWVLDECEDEVADAARLKDGEAISVRKQKGSAVYIDDNKKIYSESEIRIYDLIPQ